MSRPPHPRPLSSALALYDIVHSPYEAYRRYHRKFGDYWSYESPHGVIHVGNSPDAAKTLLGADPSTLLAFGVESASAVMGEHSMFMLSGDEHRQERTLVAPAFHHERVRRYTTDIIDKIRSHTRSIPTEGITTTVFDLGMAITWQVITDVVIGREFVEFTSQLERMLPAAVAAHSPWMLFAPNLRRVPILRKRWERFVLLRKQLEVLLQPAVAAAQDSEPGSSVLVDLAQARDEHGEPLTSSDVIDQLLTLIVAGQETTAAAVAWAMHHLMQHPEVTSSLRSALDSLAPEDPASTMRCEPLDHVCRETLRKTPSVPEIYRRLRVPLEWGGVTVPVGDTICVPIIAVHHHPDVYVKSDDFEPARFEGRRSRPWEYLPYGGGHRRCIGATLADAELRLIVGELVRGYDFASLDSGPVKSVRRHLTVAPGNGIPVSIRPRH